MNRKIAAVLVGLSIVTGIGVGYVVQQSQDAPAAAAPKQPATASTVGASFSSGPVTITGAALVASKTGGATLVATLGPLQYLHIESVTAEVRDKPLVVVVGETEGRVDAEVLRPIHVGLKPTDDDLYEPEAFVVHGVEVGQTVRIDIDFMDRADEPTPPARLDVPVVSAADMPGAVLFEGPAPKITDATIALVSGEKQARIGYTIVSRNGETERLDPSRPEQIVGAGPDGDPVAWKKQQGCCILNPLVDAFPEPVTLPDPAMADVYDYVDAAGLEVGDTVTFRFPFLAGVTTAKFEVVAG